MIPELVLGESFSTVEPTPRLRIVIDAAADALRNAAPRAAVRVGRRLDLPEGSTVVPSISLLASGGEEGDPAWLHPDLVVEVRTESTGRYILGPKRLLYATNNVPELWVIDAWRSRVAALVCDSGQAYSWPPRQYAPGATLSPTRLPGAEVPVDDLLAGWARHRGQPPAEDADWWETS